MKRNCARPSQYMSRPTIIDPLRHVARMRFFFFVMKRCHESLSRHERCVHHATLLGPTFSKTVSSPRLLKRIAGIFAAWTTNGWKWWVAKSRVEEKLQHRLVIVPKLHFCSCVGIKTLISMTSCFFTPATSENMHEILKRARWTTTEGIHRLYTTTFPSRLNLFFKLRSCMLVQTRKRLKWQQAYGEKTSGCSHQWLPQRGDICEPHGTEQL